MSARSSHLCCLPLLLLQVAPRRSGVEPDSITFSILISCLERFGEWRQALDRFDEMTDLGLESNA